MRKTLSTALVVLLIIVIGAVGYWWYQKKSAENSAGSPADITNARREKTFPKRPKNPVTGPGGEIFSTSSNAGERPSSFAAPAEIQPVSTANVSQE